jgi:exodeoxyribonuclease VII large subunit
MFVDWRNNLRLLQSRLLNAPLQGVYNANQQITDLSNRLTTAVINKFGQSKQKLASLSNIMILGAQQNIAAEKTKLAVFTSALNSAHPNNVLQRGYSMISDEHGQIISRTDDLDEGQNIILALADGTAKATVEEVIKESGKDE